MWIKICGNTNLEDASLAAQLGADALGFVFAASPRQVTPAQVAAITPHLPSHVERVGVFHSRDAGQIASIAHEAGLTTVHSTAVSMGRCTAARGKFKGTLAHHPDPALGRTRPNRSPAAQLAAQIERIARLRSPAAS